MDWFLYDNGLRHERVNCCQFDYSATRFFMRFTKRFDKTGIEVFQNYQFFIAFTMVQGFSFV